MDISAFNDILQEVKKTSESENINEYIKQITTNLNKLKSKSPTEITTAIKNKITKIEKEEYFLKLSSLITLRYELWESNKTPYTKKELLKAKLKFQIEEVKYSGYKKILTNPIHIEEIICKVIKEIEKLQNQTIEQITNEDYTQLTVNF